MPFARLQSTQGNTICKEQGCYKSFETNTQARNDKQSSKSQYDLEQKFRALYNAGFSEKLSDPKEGLSMEDKRFLKIMDTTTQLKSGHYEIDLSIKRRK